MVRLQQAVGVGDAGGGGGGDVVDDVAAERRAARRRRSSRCRTSGAWRTGRRCGRPSPTGTPDGVGEHDGHLEDDLELVADGVGARTRRTTRRSRRPGAGTPRPSATWPSAVGEVAGLAGEHQRGQRRQLLERPRRARPRRASRAAGRPGGRATSAGVQVVEVGAVTATSVVGTRRPAAQSGLPPAGRPASRSGGVDAGARPRCGRR